VALEEGLVTHLMADSGVTDLISTRLFPLVVPQDVTLPAVAYQRISGIPQNAHDGSSGLTVARIQFTCHGSSYTSAKAVAAALRAALNGKKGGMGSTEVNVSLLQDESDGWAERHGAPTVRQDYMIWYQEA
jgi:hypothetical protein